MNTQVAAAVISGSVALVVALLGIAGAIVAQTAASRRAFQNSLALFERQQRSQDQERREQARREDVYRFAEQRRTTYARFLRVTAELAEARDLADVSHDYHIDRPPETGETWPPAPLRARLAKWQRIEPAATAAADEVDLLASAEVRDAARKFWRIACQPPEALELSRSSWHPEPVESSQASDRCTGFEAARSAFVDAARRELGVTSRDRTRSG